MSMHVVIFAGFDRGDNWASVTGPFATEEEAAVACAAFARQELLALHEDDESFSETDRQEEAEERDRISALPDVEVVSEYNDNDWNATLSTGTVQPWVTGERS